MTGVLPKWLADLLGVESTGADQPMVWQLQTTWGWAPWATLLIVAAIVAWVVYFYAQEGSAVSRRTRAALASLRILALGLLLIMLAELMLSIQRTGLPSIVVLVDRSASMAVADHYDNEKLSRSLEQRLKKLGLEEPSRLNLAKMLLLENGASRLKQLDGAYRLHTYVVADTVQLQPRDLDELTTSLKSLEATGQATRLGDDIPAVLEDFRGSPPAALILLTDGISTDGRPLAEAAAYARREGVPLFTVGLGSDRPVQDVELADLLVDDVVFAGDVVQFEATVVAHGLAGREVKVILKEAHSPDVLTKTTLTLGEDGQSQQVTLPYRPEEVGDFEYTVEVSPLDEEVRKDNNAVQRKVSVRKQQIRVLLASAYPSYEYRYLKNLLDRDPTIDLNVVLQDADPQYNQGDPTALQVFPVRAEDLFGFDVVILSDVNPAFLSQSVMENLATFVTRQGGGLVFIAGPHFLPLSYVDTPLDPLFPVNLKTVSAAPVLADNRSGFRLRPTALGLSSPHMQLGDTREQTAKIWNSLPPMYWLMGASDLKPAARVLAEHPTLLDERGRPYPLLTLQYIGAGQVLFHAVDATWRWRFRLGDRYLARYWIQTIRMLSRSRLLQDNHQATLTVDRRQYAPGEEARLRTRFVDQRAAPAEDDGVTVMVEKPGQTQRQITLHRSSTSRGVFEGSLTELTPGNYHVWLTTPTSENGAPSADFVVTAPHEELERLATNVVGLTQAAERTQGRFYRIENAHRLFDDLPTGQRVPIESLPPELLWNQWWLLAAFLALLVTEWGLRKRKGLL